LRKFKVKIRGVTDYIQHKMPYGKEAEKLKHITKVLQQNSDDEEAYMTEAKIALYRTEDETVYIPATQLKGSLLEAGKEIRIEGKGKSTYKKIVGAFMFIEPEKIPVTRNGVPIKAEFDDVNLTIRRDWVVIQRSRILRTRPVIKEGWEAEFTLVVLDDTIPINVIKDLLKTAGSFKGIGDWRPQKGGPYGTYEIISFEQIQ